MKNNFLLSGMMITLVACSNTTTTQLDIEPSPLLNTLRTENKAFMLNNTDSRIESYVVMMDNGRSKPTIIHPTSTPSDTVEQVLSRQLSAQGFRILPSNSNQLNIDLMEALSKVKYSVFSHEIDTDSHAQLDVMAFHDRHKSFCRVFYTR